MHGDIGDDGDIANIATLASAFFPKRLDILLKNVYTFLKKVDTHPKFVDTQSAKSVNSASAFFYYNLSPITSNLYPKGYIFFIYSLNIP